MFRGVRRIRPMLSMAVLQASLRRNIQLLHDLVDEINDLRPESVIGHYRIWPSGQVNRLTAGWNLTGEDVKGETRYGGWDPERDTYMRINEDGDFEKTFDNAARLTAYLLDTYGLQLGDVKQHADFMDKNCPQTIRDNNRWPEFLEKVHEYKNLIPSEE